MPKLRRSKLSYESQRRIRRDRRRILRAREKLKKLKLNNGDLTLGLGLMLGLNPVRDEKADGHASNGDNGTGSGVHHDDNSDVIFIGSKTAPAAGKNPKTLGDENCLFKVPETLRAGFLLTDGKLKASWLLGSFIGRSGLGELYRAKLKDTWKPDDYPYLIKIEVQQNGILVRDLHQYLTAFSPSTKSVLEDLPLAEFTSQVTHDSDKLYIDSWKQKHGLDHLAVPKLFAFGEFEHKEIMYHFFVFEKIGCDLQGKLRTVNHRLRVSEAYNTAIQLVNAIEYLHSFGFVEADIKPTKIMETHECRDMNKVVLVDFGIAAASMPSSGGNRKRFIHTIQKTHNYSLEYMSRDAHNGDVPTKRSDIETLTYNLIRWLSGKLPWKGVKDRDEVFRLKIENMGKTDSFLLHCFLTEKFAPQLLQLLEYVRKLKYEETPSYSCIRHLLKDAMKYHFKLRITAIHQRCKGRKAKKKVSKQTPTRRRLSDEIVSRLKRKSDSDINACLRKRARIILNSKEVLSPSLGTAEPVTGQDMPLQQLQNKDTAEQQPGDSNLTSDEGTDFHPAASEEVETSDVMQEGDDVDQSSGVTIKVENEPDDLEYDETGMKGASSVLEKWTIRVEAVSGITGNAERQEAESSERQEAESSDRQEAESSDRQEAESSDRQEAESSDRQEAESSDRQEAESSDRQEAESSDRQEAESSDRQEAESSNLQNNGGKETSVSRYRMYEKGYGPYQQTHRASSRKFRTSRTSRKSTGTDQWNFIEVLSDMHACVFCDSMLCDMTDHLLQFHKHESEVLEAMTKLPCTFEPLIRRGDHRHNIKVLQRQHGTLLVLKYCVNTKSLGDYMPCPDCLAYIFYAEFLSHRQDCKVSTEKQKEGDKKKADLDGAPQSKRVKCTLSAGEVSNIIKTNVLRNFVVLMLSDAIALIPIPSRLITSYEDSMVAAERRSTPLEVRKETEEIMRLLGHLKGSYFTRLKESFDPTKFHIVFKLMKWLYDYSRQEDTLQSGISLKQRLVSELGHCLKACASQMKDKLGAEENQNALSCRVEKYLSLFDSMVNDISVRASPQKIVRGKFVRASPSKTVRTISVQASPQQIAAPVQPEVNMPKTPEFCEILLLTNDILKLEKYLNLKMEGVLQKLTSKPTICKYLSLLEVTLAKLILFNKPRANEVVMLTVASYKDSAHKLDSPPDILQCLPSTTERKLCERLFVIQVPNKEGVMAPILITPKVKTTLDFLLETRSLLRIHPFNPYLFAKDANEYVNVCEVLYAVTAYAGLQNPQLLMSMSQERNVTTICQILAMNGGELNWLKLHIAHPAIFGEDVHSITSSSFNMATVVQLLCKDWKKTPEPHIAGDSNLTADEGTDFHPAASQEVEPSDVMQEGDDVDQSSGVTIQVKSEPDDLEYDETGMKGVREGVLETWTVRVEDALSLDDVKSEPEAEEDEGVSGEVVDQSEGVQQRNTFPETRTQTRATQPAWDVFHMLATMQEKTT